MSEKKELITPMLFYFYAHEDSHLYNQLDKHLRLLQRQGLIATWSNHQIMPGDDWASSLNQHLKNAEVILLLISANFLASDYCYSREMQYALERAHIGKAIVIPVILRPCDWRNASFAHLLPLPRNARPVTLWKNQDMAYLNIVEGIREAVGKLSSDEAIAYPSFSNQPHITSSPEQRRDEMHQYNPVILERESLEHSILSSRGKRRAAIVQSLRPYFFTSERIAGFVERSKLTSDEGLIADTIYGYHTLWAAEIPVFTIYSYKTSGFRFEELYFLLRRQKRFLSRLAQLREYQTTIEMRFVAWPHQPTQVGIAFLGKVFHKNKQTSYNSAVELWDKFSALFPKDAPFSYPLIPVQFEDNKTYQQTHNFSQWYQPIPFEQLIYSENIVELRKREDWPVLHVGESLYARDYIPRPFEPALDYSAMTNLLKVLASQKDTCVVSVVLRPQRLSNEEIVFLSDLLSWYKEHKGIKAVNAQHTDSFNEMYLDTRAKLGLEVYERLLGEQHCLFKMRLQVTGSPRAQQDVIEAFSSGVIANTTQDSISIWTHTTTATQQEFHLALFNMQWLDFSPWSISPFVQQFPYFIHLRQLSTIDEAMGTFRLPVRLIED